MIYYITPRETETDAAMSPKIKAATADASGVGLSVLCVAHCLAAPAAAAAGPALAPVMGEAFWGEGAHIALFLVAAPLSVLGFVWGSRVVKAGFWTIAAAVFGLFLMLFAAAHVAPDVLHTPMPLAGVAILAGAHLANWRARLKAGHVHERECGVCASR